MARARKYGEDLTYAEAHRHALPQTYGRLGHRCDMADRDFTEFCHYCRQPLLLCETVRDVGQDLRDKATTVTRHLAARARLDARLVAWRVRRSAADQAEIDAINRRLRVLEARSPLVAVTVRRLWPQLSSELHELTPAEWWRAVLILHRDHHRQCSRAQEFPVLRERLRAAKARHRLHGLSLLDDL